MDTIYLAICIAGILLAGIMILDLVAQTTQVGISIQKTDNAYQIIPLIIIILVFDPPDQFGLITNVLNAIIVFWRINLVILGIIYFLYRAKVIFRVHLQG